MGDADSQILPASASEAEIAAHHLARLHALIATLRTANAFYAPRIESAGLDDRAFSREDFISRMPFTTRAEWTADQEDHPPYGSNLTYPLDQYSRFSRTSGSTGSPRLWLDTRESWSAMLDCWEKVYRSAGVDDRSRIMFAFSFGPFLGFWTAFDAAVRIGALAIPGGGLSTDARLSVLADTRCDTLCCTPTYAIHLARIAGRHGFSLGPGASCDIPVARIIVAGEPGGSISSTRNHIQELWGGAELIDHHGMTEVGPVSYQCPSEPGVLHVIEDAFMAEVVNPDTGTPVAPGTEGELVLTTLRREASPLIRYRTGDRVSAGRHTPCQCGTHNLRLVGGILGRSDDMIIVRGVNIFPAAVEKVIRSIPDISEYRVNVSDTPTLRELRISIELRSGVSDYAAVRAHTEHQLKDAFALRIPVEIAPRNTLPRFELKARRWVME